MKNSRDIVLNKYNFRNAINTHEYVPRVVILLFFKVRSSISKKPYFVLMHMDISYLLYIKTCFQKFQNLFFNKTIFRRTSVIILTWWSINLYVRVCTCEPGCVCVCLSLALLTHTYIKSFLIALLTIKSTLVQIMNYMVILITGSKENASAFPSLLPFRWRKNNSSPHIYPKSNKGDCHMYQSQRLRTSKRENLTCHSPVQWPYGIADLLLCFCINRENRI